jgi:hypothetical protein
MIISRTLKVWTLVFRNTFLGTLGAACARELVDPK